MILNKTCSYQKYNRNIRICEARTFSGKDNRNKKDTEEITL